jgi:short-subunit dehydrogenase
MSSPRASPKHVAVTGASSGIGEAIARELATTGARITLVARRRDKLEAIAAQIGPQARVCVHDLSDHTRATAWIAEAEAAQGPIDVLVNNAGVENTGPMLSSDTETALTLLRTNLLTPLLLARHVAPAMVARGGGTIVNVASVASFAAVPMQSWYGASKAGFGMFSEVIRAELRGTGVNVLTVYPGPVTTPMGEAAYAKFGGRKGTVGLMPEGKPDVLAKLVRRGIERGQSRIVYPAFYCLAWLFPWLARILSDSAVKPSAVLPRQA